MFNVTDILGVIIVSNSQNKGGIYLNGLLLTNDKPQELDAFLLQKIFSGYVGELKYWIHCEFKEDNMPFLLDSIDAEMIIPMNKFLTGCSPYIKHLEIDEQGVEWENGNSYSYTVDRRKD